MAAALLLLLLLLVPPVGLLAILAFLTRPRATRIPLKGRHVFITGGSSGIGLAMARAAAREGARVSILARNLARLEDARAAIQRDSGRDDVGVGVYAADVRDAADAVARALEEAGRPRRRAGLQPRRVRVAGAREAGHGRGQADGGRQPHGHLPPRQGLAPRHEGARLPGSIAIMSSQAGQVGIYGYAAYSASKFALRGLGEALQHEIIPHDIHVSLIFPPDTQTPGLREEQKTRSELTSIIAGSSGGMKADDVAKKALDCIKAAKFIVPCNF